MKRTVVALSLCALAAACGKREEPPPSAAAMPTWELENPLKPLPEVPLGTDIQLASLTNAPTPESVRLGRWLFYDTRLSKDGNIACATCHRPEHAFSEPTPTSSGIDGQKGGRKAP